MPIETILILVVVTISIVWAFKTGYIKALWKGYVFSFAHGTAEDGSFVPVLKLEQGWKFRKLVEAFMRAILPDPEKVGTQLGSWVLSRLGTKRK